MRARGVELVQRPGVVDDIEHLAAEQVEGHAGALDVVGQEVRARGVELVQRPGVVDDIEHLAADQVEGHTGAVDVVGQEVRARGVELVQRPGAVDDNEHLAADQVEGRAGACDCQHLAALQLLQLRSGTARGGEPDARVPWEPLHDRTLQIRCNHSKQ